MRIKVWQKRYSQSVQEMLWKNKFWNFLKFLMLLLFKFGWQALKQAAFSVTSYYITGVQFSLQRIQILRTGWEFGERWCGTELWKEIILTARVTVLSQNTWFVHRMSQVQFPTSQVEGMGKTSDRGSGELFRVRAENIVLDRLLISDNFIVHCRPSVV